MKPTLRYVVLAAALTFNLNAGVLSAWAQTDKESDPANLWSTEFVTGALWSVGGNASPVDYLLLPQQFVVRTPNHLQGQLWDGLIMVRSRLSFEVAPVLHGPETYFSGITAAPSLEWWSSNRKFYLSVSGGGGVGLMDSAGTELNGGQGQDFNLTWFLHAGLGWRFSEHGSLSVGLLYQHISNGGQNRINPGIDALGPTLGLQYSF